ncbi:YheT family hydrolase [Silvibacterium sp.]|uniref:YheT family hydrolase n=1 Tax=Silvibacterium sp. TaxID=1964179 RepID=UPI0039E2859D
MSTTAAYGTLQEELAEATWLRPFTPHRRLRNGHFQTLAGNFIPRRPALPEPEELLIEVEGPVEGYGPSHILCHCHWQPEEVRRDRLTLIIVHGLEGSSRSQYVLGNTERALAAGHNVIRMNMRSCGGTDHLCPTIYHSGRSEDVTALVTNLVEARGLRRIALLGYSMGGNLILKYAGEVASAPPPEFVGVIGVSPLMDLAASSDALHRRSNYIYMRHFLRNMRGRLHRKAALYPRIYGGTDIDAIRTMRDFDEHIVARFGGFEGATHYHHSVASSHFASDFRVPTLIIHSTDDPFIVMRPETRAALLANPHVHLAETSRGGHCAFLAAGDPAQGRKVEYWAEDTLHGWLARLPGNRSL